MRGLENIIINGGGDRSSYAPFWPDEEGAPGLVPARRTISSLTSTEWDLSLMPLNDYQALAGEIAELAKNAVERNLFFEPAFFMAGLQRVSHPGVMLLCLWETLAGKRTLRFFMPLAQQRVGIPRRLVAHCFTHHFAPLGTPLLHHDNKDETIETLLRLLGDPALELPDVISFEQQRMGGKTVELLQQAAIRLGLACESTLVMPRAMLLAQGTNADDDMPYLRESMGAKRYRDYNRLLRRLEKSGKVTFEVARKPDAVLDALEGFLSLEARGWKGRGGTALYSLKQIAAFSRQAVSSLAAIDACEIHGMLFDGKIISSLICFKQKGEIFTWKIAFDEEFKIHSPGVQLMSRATMHWLAQKSFKRADSLASANHSMMDRLWKDRQETGTLLIGTGKHGARQVTSARRAMEHYDGLKELVKSILKRLHRIF